MDIVATVIKFALPFQMGLKYMKIRKSLVAIASALAVSTAGVTAVSAAEGDNPDKPAASQSSSIDGLFGSSSGTSDKDEDSKTDPADIKNWIGVFTAIIGAIGAAYTLIQRFTK